MNKYYFSTSCVRSRGSACEPSLDLRRYQKHISNANSNNESTFCLLGCNEKLGALTTTHNFVVFHVQAQVDVSVVGLRTL